CGGGYFADVEEIIVSAADVGESTSTDQEKDKMEVIVKTKTTPNDNAEPEAYVEEEMIQDVSLIEEEHDSALMCDRSRKSSTIDFSAVLPDLHEDIIGLDPPTPSEQILVRELPSRETVTTSGILAAKGR
ncbi:unnamed protein product, partial [Amoebophrya sp. A25]